MLQGAEMGSALVEPMRGVVLALFSKLEKDKASLDLNPAEDPALCEAFAINIFNRANRVDKAGKADDLTAKTFYVASIFFMVRLHPLKHAQSIGGSSGRRVQLPNMDVSCSACCRSGTRNKPRRLRTCQADLAVDATTPGIQIARQCGEVLLDSAERRECAACRVAADASPIFGM